MTIVIPTYVYCLIALVFFFIGVMWLGYVACRRRRGSRIRNQTVVGLILMIAGLFGLVHSANLLNSENSKAYDSQVAQMDPSWHSLYLGVKEIDNDTYLRLAFLKQSLNENYSKQTISELKPLIKLIDVTKEEQQASLYDTLSPYIDFENR